MRKVLVFLLLIGCGVGLWSQGSIPILEINLPRLVKTFEVPSSSYRGGISIGAGMPGSASPINWQYVDGKHYVTENPRLLTSIFDENFKLLSTIEPAVEVYYPRDDINIVAFDNLELAISEKGIIRRITPENKVVATYDLSAELLAELREEGEQTIPPHVTYHVYANGNDGVIFGNGGRLQFVLLQNGKILKERTDLENYIKTTLASFPWASKRPELLRQIQDLIVPQLGFVGDYWLSPNIIKPMFDLLTDYFAAKGQSVPRSEISSRPKASDRGFWVPIINNRDPQYDGSSYYFDLVSDQVYLLKGFSPAMFVWDETRKIAFSANRPENTNKVIISQYALDFFKD